MKPFLFLIGLAFGLTHYAVYSAAREVSRSAEHRQMALQYTQIIDATDSYAALVINDYIGRGGFQCDLFLPQEATQ